VASEPVTPFYTDNTPPMPLSRADTHRSSAAPSLSTSPEHHPRPFQLASSPPVRNKTSGEELSSSTPSQTGVNWNKSKPFTRSDSTIRRSFMSQGFGDDYDGSTTEDDESLPPQSRVKISLKNQDMFDDEGCPSVAFLDPNQSIKFAVYRAVYANMLGAWGLQMQQNEVDKLDGLLSNILTRTESRDRGSQSTLTLGEAETDQETLDGLGPQVIRCCMSCGEVDGSERRGAGCVKCGGRSHLLSCTICYQPIAGLYKVCLACGHSAHVSCLAILLESLAEDEASECEAGCGCACDEKAAVGGEEMFGMTKAPTFEEEVAKETGFRMLQPVRLWIAAAYASANTPAGMQNSLSDAINTALTAAATEAVGAAIREAFAKTIDKTVKIQAKKLDKAFAAAVDEAVTCRSGLLDAVRQKETDMRIDKAVKKAVLEAKIEEREFAILIERELYDKVESGDADPKNCLFRLDEHFHDRMDGWKKELAEYEEAQEEKV
ncbi:hypothetical protein KCU77_g10179, partial [Aureobasidium melanogenum]